MRYRALLETLKSLSEECLDQDVTVYNKEMREFSPVIGSGYSSEVEDRLDEGTFFLTIKD